MPSGRELLAHLQKLAKYLYNDKVSLPVIQGPTHHPPERLMVCKPMSRDWPGSKQRDTLLRIHGEEISSALLLVAHHGVHMSELRFYERRLKLGQIIPRPIHEDYVDDVITNVPLPLNLNIHYGSMNKSN